jgi:hypothetical protein
MKIQKSQNTREISTPIIRCDKEMQTDQPYIPYQSYIKEEISSPRSMPIENQGFANIIISV